MKKNLVFGIIFIYISFLSAMVKADIKTGLVADFPFSGEAIDVSGNNYRATVFGATLTEDRFGNANSAYVFSPNQSIQTNINGEKFNSAMSVSFWMKTKKSDYYYCRNRPYLISTYPLDGEGHHFSYCANGNNADSLNFNLKLWDDQWHHLAINYKSDSISIYIDGNVFAKKSIDSFSFKGDYFKFGKLRPSSVARYEGVLDDIKIYNRSLSDNDVWELFKENKKTPITTNNNIFDGAGSIISPAEDCYGCDKDAAVMQPHQEGVSTVVFQWRQNNSCSMLTINSDLSLPVIISAKTWNSPSIEKTYKATISENNFFSLGSLGKWTTFSLTSTLPITKPIRIDAKCADVTSVSSQQVKTSDVVVDSGAKWMGTGSIISRAQQGDVNGYGVLKDVSIGSQNSTALTSFQWYASPSCSKLIIGDGTNTNATISKKLWDEASFSQICTTLPCNINGVSGKYYVLKIESNAGTFPIPDGSYPGGMISAICH